MWCPTVILALGKLKQMKINLDYKKSFLQINKKLEENIKHQSLQLARS